METMPGITLAGNGGSTDMLQQKKTGVLIKERQKLVWQPLPWNSMHVLGLKDFMPRGQLPVLQTQS